MDVNAALCSEWNASPNTRVQYEDIVNGIRNGSGESRRDDECDERDEGPQANATAELWSPWSMGDAHDAVSVKKMCEWWRRTCDVNVDLKQSLTIDVADEPPIPKPSYEQTCQERGVCKTACADHWQTLVAMDKLCRQFVSSIATDDIKTCNVLLRCWGTMEGNTLWQMFFFSCLSAGGEPANRCVA